MKYWLIPLMMLGLCSCAQNITKPNVNTEHSDQQNVKIISQKPEISYQTQGANGEDAEKIYFKPNIIFMYSFKKGEIEVVLELPPQIVDLPMYDIYNGRIGSLANPFEDSVFYASEKQDDILNHPVPVFPGKFNSFFIKDLKPGGKYFIQVYKKHNNKDYYSSIKMIEVASHAPQKQDNIHAVYEDPILSMTGEEFVKHSIVMHRESGSKLDDFSEKPYGDGITNWFLLNDFKDVKNLPDNLQNNDVFFMNINKNITGFLVTDILKDKRSKIQSLYIEQKDITSIYKKFDFFMVQGEFEKLQDNTQPF